MARRPKTRPANGNSQDELAGLLQHKAVWKLLLLWGTYRPGASQEEIAQRVRELSPNSARYQITDEQLIQLYHLAIADAEQPVTLQKKAA